MHLAGSGFSPLQSSALTEVIQRIGATAMQVGLAWLLRRSPNILLIRGTSSRGHSRENLAAAELSLPDGALAALGGIAGSRRPTHRPGGQAVRMYRKGHTFSASLAMDVDTWRRPALRLYNPVRG